MDTQKIDSSRVKTHEEILKLIEDVRSAQARVQNPGEFLKPSFDQITVLKQIEPLLKQHERPPVVHPPIQPTREIKKPDHQPPRKPVVIKTQKPEPSSEKKKKWFDFLKIEVTEDEEVPLTPEVEPEPEDPIAQPSTFVLQLDTSGNLVGFPLKKTHEHRKPQEPEGEREKGIKGIIQRLGSKFHRKSSEESESAQSSGGIADKIKGIFRRKNKE